MGGPGWVSGGGGTEKLAAVHQKVLIWAKIHPVLWKEIVDANTSYQEFSTSTVIPRSTNGEVCPCAAIGRNKRML